jgi:hypothetical protein
MGNQNSRATTPTSNPQSPTNVSGHSSSHGHHTPHSHNQYHSARRRESIQALSTAKAPAAPEVSLENAGSHPTSRGRAQTVGTSTKAVANQLRAAQDTIKTSNSPDNSSMGNEQSSQKGQHKDKNFPRDATPPQPHSTTISQQQPEPEPAPRATSPSPPTQPVDVPFPAAREESGPELQDGLGVSSIDAGDAQDYFPSAQFSRPPRLPLPIEEEVHTPGSPIISPQEIWSPIHENDAEGMLPNRRTSMLSTTTADDEDLGDEFKGPSTGRPTVPTLIEWEGPGERVYVTGTFAGWNRKYKLHRK